MNEKADRAKLFAPFAALTGFDELVAQSTRENARRRERSDEENETLSKRMLSLRRGMRVRVTVYEDGDYHSFGGVVERVELVSRTLVLKERKLLFDDIYAVDLPD